VPFVAAFGLWPQRAIILAMLVPLGFVVVLLPWRIGGWRSRRQRERGLMNRPKRLLSRY